MSVRTRPVPSRRSNASLHSDVLAPVAMRSLACRRRLDPMPSRPGSAEGDSRIRHRRSRSEGTFTEPKPVAAGLHRRQPTTGGGGFDDSRGFPLGAGRDRGRTPGTALPLLEYGHHRLNRSGFRRPFRDPLPPRRRAWEPPSGRRNIPLDNLQKRGQDRSECCRLSRYVLSRLSWITTYLQLSASHCRRTG